MVLVKASRFRRFLEFDIAAPVKTSMATPRKTPSQQEYPCRLPSSTVMGHLGHRFVDLSWCFGVALNDEFPLGFLFRWGPLPIWGFKWRPLYLQRRESMGEVSRCDWLLVTMYPFEQSLENRWIVGLVLLSWPSRPFTPCYCSMWVWPLRRKRRRCFRLRIRKQPWENWNLKVFLRHGFLCDFAEVGIFNKAETN